jgi:hypothetical protein
MLRNLTTTLVIFSLTASYAQNIKLTDINLVGGLNFSTFIFKDSGGEKDKTLDYEALSSFGINFNFITSRHILRPELSFRQAGAKSDYDGLALSWKMNYLDINFAYLINVINSERFLVAPGIAFGAGYMLTGEQYIGSKRYSITDNKSLKTFDLGFQGLAHFRANITDNLSLSLEYRFGMGITQIENNDTEQKSRNMYNSALLGLGIRLK